MDRRTILKAFLASVLLAPLAAFGTETSVARQEYSGPDDPDTFQKTLAEQSSAAVVMNVFHATWCGPCKSLFAQMDDIRRQPGIKIQLLGVDIDKYPKISKAMLPMVATPQSFFYIYGQPQAYKFAGTIRNVPEMTRYLRELTRAVHGDQPGVPRL
ncbi:MAG: hypothetical protein HYS17_04095 [Micavibrio aeruginosavorus]|uniref:Thioredoxin domain-containing protein n=1 Tax=Micavibrio aeruginosavorus TaxID=349221 RepID=A0A7T5R3S3_9BACT|nr:MAG: hypothetical protein HYS17_04095 [Micavibrio aeruginosavorus]